MIETEVKILEIDKEKIISVVESLGGKKIFDDIIDARIYDNGSIIANKNVLRLRKEGSSVKLTYKEFILRDDFKSMDEHEVEVGSFEDVDLILRRLGFKVVGGMKKMRVSYLLDKCRIDIDEPLEKYGCIPPLMEIEGKREDILRLANRMSIKRESFTSMNTRDLIEKYCK